jgi:uncharacterized protein (DUF111 family)
VGLGTRQLDRPNLVRLTLAEPLEPSGLAGSAGDQEEIWAERQETVLLQQAQIDDASAEDLAFLAAELRAAGALEVFSQVIAMKKGRSGVLLSVLAPPERAEELRRLWWRHSTSLGVREQLQRRWILPRREQLLETALGPVRLKWARLPQGGERVKPEHDDLASLARRHNLSLEQVRAVVQQALESPP